MKRHLNVFIPDGLLEALDAFAVEHGLNRSQATRLLIALSLWEPRPSYTPPTLPNWQTEAWTSLLRGLFGSGRLILTDEIKALLADAVGTLDERAARVLRLRFGLDGPRHTLAEVGAIFGVGRRRIHQVEGLALRRLRRWLRGSGVWELLGEQLELEKNI